MKYIQEIGTDGNIDNTQPNQSLGETSRSATVTSNNITIVVNGYVVWAVQKFGYSENRTDGGVEVWGHVHRIMYDNISIMEAFGGQHHIRNNYIPVDDPDLKKFDIVINFLDRSVTIKNVIIMSHNCDFGVDDIVVRESIAFMGDSIVTNKAAMIERPKLSRMVTK